VLDSPRTFVPSMEDAVTDHYARIDKQLRKAGKPIPTNDMWIAACAMGEGSALFTLDAHFDAILGLPVVHRRADFERLASSASP
jgi:predicted nucleic acid-binding protein